VFLEIPGDVGLLFSHLKQGSIPVVQSQAVAKGAALGQVGHSGSTSWPHLHFEAQDIANGFASLPLAIQNAEVRLNPVSADPWLRQVPVWGIREGFLVSNGPPAQVPALTGWPLVLFGAAVLAAARRSLR
jgi:murein DD-endopeptidase MepM/ murein hydrolase activator NlpD